MAIRDDTFPPLPTFLIIGAQKSATRWLRHNLAKHPDVFAAHDELHFFDHHEPTFEALQSYRDNFADHGGEAHVGEVTPGYLFWRNNPALVAKRIAETLPRARLLALLRNPVDRAVSALSHHMRRGRVDPRTGLLEWVRSRPPEDDHLGIVSGGWYAASLHPYDSRFGAQLRVLLQDDVAVDAASAYRVAADHLGLDPAVPDGVALARHSFPPPQGSSLDDGEGGLRRLTRDERAELYEFFADDVGQLESLLGRTLPWRPIGR